MEKEIVKLLTPALSLFGPPTSDCGVTSKERENYIMGRFPGVGARRHRANPGLISVAPLGQVSFRLRQTSTLSFESVFTRRARAPRGRSVFIRG
jgi:hypothetical protein